MTPTSAVYDIPFATFRANTTGTESWKKLTEQHFLEGLDAHLDRVLSEYRAMLNMVVRLIEDKDLSKQGISDQIMTAFPYAEAQPSEGDLRHQIAEGPVFADERFKGWRELERADLLDLCRQHYDRLTTEHAHLSATLASTVNRIGDPPGWGHWQAENIRNYLYGQLIWSWPAS